MYSEIFKQMIKSLTDRRIDMPNSTGTIESIEDISDESTNFARIKFTNGYKLCVVSVKPEYGNNSGLCELAVMDNHSCYKTSCFDVGERNYCVLKFCDKAKVEHYIYKIGNLL